MSGRGPLAGYAADVTSQFGEDGILAEILDRLATSVPLSHWCIDVGAADGVWFSNVCTLVRERGYRAVMVESDAGRFADLVRNHPDDAVVKIHARVGWEGDHRLDRILATTPVPTDPDVCSIDVDGNDYWLLGALGPYRPKVLVVEFNPTVPNAVDYAQAPDPHVARGSSARAIERRGGELGYAAVAATVCNLILVRVDLVGAVVDTRGGYPTLDGLRDPSTGLVHAFTGFDGTTILSAPLVDPWRHHVWSVGDVQALPALLRRYPADRSRTRLRVWRVYRWLRRQGRRGARRLTRTAPVVTRDTVLATAVVPAGPERRPAPPGAPEPPGSAGEEIDALLRALHPWDAGIPLVRLGPDGDGGYLVPDDLEGIAACFSPGVGDVSGFDDDCAGRGMVVFQADATVADPGGGHRFTARNLGATDAADAMTLATWLAEASPPAGDLLLQMDVEGHEWSVLLSTPPEVLARFRIVVLEVHDLGALDRNPYRFVVRAALDRLLAGHVCVHAHPNNASGLVEVAGRTVPSELELTFLRRDRVRHDGFVTRFPHPLDRDNVARPTVVLPAGLHRSDPDG